MAYVPFWLKALILSMALNLGGDQPGLSTNPGPIGDTGALWELAGLALVVFLAGVGTGIWFSNRVRPKERVLGQQSANPWVRLVSRALHFIHRRRATSLAFRSLGESTLRNSEGSKPNQARRRRVATPGPRTSPGSASTGVIPLDEGPVISTRRNGAI